ncbi:multiple epidermal growth factor-like domains protein 10 [Argopecten irradians]|uniref:multiple epidermal growth factor-like domains protein 10 n=1 Tax=Argopecten irradians TaxID=31199 RepID=UPI00371E2B9A
MCKPGYNGTDGVKSLSPGTYGDGCASSCVCHVNNSISCDHVTGYCTCAAGYDQPDCAQVCSYLKYGDQCSLSCSCPTNAYPACNHVTGVCTCQPGYTGATCDAVCADNTFGIGCIGVCDCVASNTYSCDKGTGVCVCNSGWSGTRCDTASAFALIDSPILIGGLGFLAALVVAVIIVLILWFACRCSCRELKSRRKKDLVELSEVTMAPSPAIVVGEGPPAKTKGNKPIGKEFPKDNDGV